MANRQYGQFLQLLQTGRLELSEQAALAVVPPLDQSQNPSNWPDPPQPVIVLQPDGSEGFAQIRVGGEENNPNTGELYRFFHDPQNPGGFIAVPDVSVGENIQELSTSFGRAIFEEQLPYETPIATELQKEIDSVVGAFSLGDITLGRVESADELASPGLMRPIESYPQMEPVQYEANTLDARAEPATRGFRGGPDEVTSAQPLQSPIEWAQSLSVPEAAPQNAQQQQTMGMQGPLILQQISGHLDQGALDTPQGRETLESLHEQSVALGGRMSQITAEFIQDYAAGNQPDFNTAFAQITGLQMETEPDPWEESTFEGGVGYAQSLGKIGFNLPGDVATEYSEQIFLQDVQKIFDAIEHDMTEDDGWLSEDYETQLIADVRRLEDQYGYGSGYADALQGLRDGADRAEMLQKISDTSSARNEAIEVSDIARAHEAVLQEFIQNYSQQSSFVGEGLAALAEIHPELEQLQNIDQAALVSSVQYMAAQFESMGYENIITDDGVDLSRLPVQAQEILQDEVDFVNENISPQALQNEGVGLN